MNDVMAHFGKCCNPIPGDKIVGFITRGRGVSVHRVNCPNVNPLLYGTERLIEVTWDVRKNTPSQVEINVLCIDKAGLLAQITTAISQGGVNIINADIQTTHSMQANCRFCLEITNLKQLQKVIASIKAIHDVTEVYRTSSFTKKTITK